MPTLPPMFITMKPVSGQCNISCKYCFYKHIDRGKMPLHVVKAVINSCSTGSMLGWQGGEPTLAGLDFYRQAVDIRPDIRHSLMTNGILIDKEWANFLAKNDFLVGVSLDGSRVIHNTFRSNWHETISGIQHLLESGVAVNAVITVNRANWNHGVHIYRAIKKLGIDYMQFIPVFGNVLYDGCAVDGYEFGVFLLSVFHEWLKHDVGKIGVQLFDECMLVASGQRAQCCVHSQRCGGFVVEADGDIYACEHFIDLSLLGNIYTDSFADLIESKAFQIFASDKLSTVCNDCEYLEYCWSGCRKHRINGLDNIYCEAYKAFYKEFLAEIIPLI